MNEKFNGYLNKVSSLTLHVHEKIISPIIDSKSFSEEPKRFFYSLLFKINNGLDTVNDLLKGLQSRPHRLDSALLIFRTILSDVINFHYILIKSSGNENDLKDYIQRIYFDHVKYTIGNLNIYKILYKDSEESIEEKRQSLKKKYPNFYDAGGIPIVKKLPPISGMMEELGKENKSNTLIEIAFEHYDIFSKYEHVGILTFDLIHLPFDSKQQPKILNEITSSISVIIETQEWLVKFFLDENHKDLAELRYLKQNIETTAF